MSSKPEALPLRDGAASAVALQEGACRSSPAAPGLRRLAQARRGQAVCGQSSLPAACVVWLTGLSGAGKSTIAAGLRARLAATGCVAVILDGDEIRSGLSRDLGFGHAQRSENVRRIAEVARLLSSQGIVTIVAAVSPLREHRTLARAIVGAPFHEVFVHAPLAVCERRDVKGLYARARRGEVPGFTGVSDVYETPLGPELRVDTQACDVSAAVALVLSSLGGRVPALGQATPAPSGRRSRSSQ